MLKRVKIDMDSRKEAILEAIVREYVEASVPVGSLILTEKYQFPFSSATIRAEMAELERLGFLTHPHTSAGRIPTEKGYRYYVNMMAEEEKLLAREELVAQKRITSMQDRYEKQLETASEVISDLTRNIGFAGLSGEIFYHGLRYLLSQPEFLDPIRILKAGELVDNLTRLIEEIPYSENPHIYIGSEIPVGKSAGCALVLSGFKAPSGHAGIVGVLGPMRMPYRHNLSVISEVKSLLENKNG